MVVEGEEQVGNVGAQFAPARYGVDRGICPIKGPGKPEGGGVTMSRASVALKPGQCARVFVHSTPLDGWNPTIR